MNAEANLQVHAEFLERELDDMRDFLGAVPDDDKVHTYIAMAKEYRLTVKQLREMGCVAKPKDTPKARIADMRVLVNRAV